MTRPCNALVLSLFALVGLAGGCTRRSSSSHSPGTTPSALTAPAAVSVDERLQLAEQSASTGEIYAAIQQLQIACDAGAGDEPRNNRRLAELYNALGEPEEAADVLTKAVARPHPPDALPLLLAQTRSKLGDFAGAAEALKPLLPRFATLEAPDQQFVARTFLLAGDSGHVAMLLPAATTDPDWLALKGLAELAQDRPAPAAEWFAQAMARSPQDAWDTYLLGFARRAAGDSHGAMDAWSQAARLPDAPGEAVLGLAELLARGGQAADAGALLRRVQGDDLKSPAYWRAALQVERSKGNAVAAALAEGYLNFYSGDPWQAEAIWKAALPKAKGDDARELYAALHNSAFKRQEPQAALRYATEAVQRWPSDPYFLKRRAEVLLGQNRMAEAEVEALKLQKTAPPDQAAEVAELLCRIALDAGKPDLLKQNADRYRQLRPRVPDPLFHLAEWQEQQGRDPQNLEKTLALYQQALTLDPKNAEAEAHTGLLLADLQRPKEAIPALLHALTLWPRVQDGTPHARLVQLYQREGKTPEVRFHAAEYQKLRRIKERWPTLLKALRQDRPLAEWKELGDTALLRRENWIALCAFHRVTQLAPKDPSVWRSLAAVYKRMGYFEEAFNAVLHARRLEGTNAS
jgi:tetratricopeptide (TPR) repeat protein